MKRLWQKIRNFFIPPVVLSDTYRWFPVKESDKIVVVEKRRKVHVYGREGWLVVRHESGEPIRRIIKK